MISIKKTETAPKILREKGKKETDNLCEEFLKNKADYKSGRKKFTFRKTIYGGTTVKNALKKAQNDKCFVCESKISHNSYGDVEHFRPKGGVFQSKEEKEMTVPGYYWLAYSWENLFLSCMLCNQRFKRNFFPLENPDERAKSHESDLKSERPLFINPETENPEEYISFRGEIPFAIDGSLRGKTTIDLLAIGRVELNEERLKVLKKLKRIYDLANLDPQIPESIEALEYLKECQKSSEEYAAAIRANVKDGFKFVLK